MHCRVLEPTGGGGGTAGGEVSGVAPVVEVDATATAPGSVAGELPLRRGPSAVVRDDLGVSISGIAAVVDWASKPSEREAPKKSRSYVRASPSAARFGERLGEQGLLQVMPTSDEAAEMSEAVSSSARLAAGESCADSDTGAGRLAPGWSAIGKRKWKNK